MFIRYDVNYAALTNTTANMATIMTDIVGALNGTITTPSGFNAVACNTATSKITGGPLASIKLDDGTTAAYSTPDWNTSQANGLVITKKHSAYNAANSYTPQTYFYIMADSTAAGFRTRLSNNLGTTTMYPDASLAATRFWIDTAFINKINPTNVTRIHVFASKYWFIVQFIDTSGKAFASGTFDFESTPEDVYHFKNTSAYCVPSIGIQSEIVSTVLNAAASTTDRVIINRAYYPTVSGYYYAYTADGYSTQASGSKALSYNGSFSVIPALTDSMYQNYADGYTGAQNKLTPMFMEGYGQQAVYAPAAKVRKMPEFYRTTDNFMLNGEQVTINGVNYRNIVLHKTADATTTTSIALAANTRNACYLIPETIGGV